MSFATFKSKDLTAIGRLVVFVFSTLRLISVSYSIKDDEEWVECSNMTIINFALKLMGPLHERTLTVRLLLLQVGCVRFHWFWL